MHFKDIIGQEDIKRRLIQSVKDNRVSHAQLFLGKEGVGKLPMALAYAQYICCKNKKENDSCGVCPSCIKYQKLIHPDLHFLYPIASTKNRTAPVSKDFLPEWRSFLIQNKYVNINDWYDFIGLENKQGIINAKDCNEIIKTLSLKAYESEYKIVIIWMVEKLFYSAAPKLLKILEEPPDKTLFVLISENQDQIINTILSRTQIIKFPKIETSELKNHLINKFNIDEDKASQIIFLSDNNLLEATKILNNDEDETYYFNAFKQWMRMCWIKHKEYLNLLSWIEEISKIGREKQKTLLLYSLKITRECMLYNNGANEMLKIDDEHMNFIKDFSSYLNNNNYVQINEELNKASFHIERNANPKILFTDLSFKIVNHLKPKK